MTENKNQIHKGHRERMKKRFLENKGNGFMQHELLEIVLYSLLPRVNTNEIAHDIIQRYGSLKNMLLYGNYDEFMTVDGIGDKSAFYLSAICNLFRQAEDYETKRKYLRNRTAYKSYALNMLKKEATEAVIFVCLNENDEIIRYKILSRGKSNHVTLSLYELARFVISTDCKKVMMAHNHPMGEAIPSMEDIFETQRIKNFLSELEIQLVDHIVVNEKNAYSIFENHEL